ncbi:MAG: iron-containing alcohol dehydrogenase [Haliea sp.]|nr:iron-containing alcohol dehydrogenase [Haliea sp.]
MSSTGAFQYWQRTMVHAGPGTVVRLPGLFEGLGARRVLLVSDKGLEAVGIVDRIAALFDDRSTPGGPKLVGVFTDTAPDAESSCIDEALRLARETGADGLLALGGGSVLDSVKMIKMALHQKVGSVSELLKSPVRIMNWPEVQHMGVPHIAVPTTAGTGAELTFGAVIYNKHLGIKHLFLSHFLEADIAVLDAHMTTGLPPMLTAATGLDALTHAVESLAHPRINHFGLAHAAASARLIVENLPRAVANGQDLAARQSMLNASAMACNAVQADFGAAPVHNFSHAIGALFHIHHGEANAVFLPTVMEEMPEFYLPVAERLKQAFSIQSTAPEQIVSDAAAAIRRLMTEIDHPQDFSRHGIPQTALENIIAAVAHDPLAAFYPLGPDVIEAVCRRVCGW